MKKSRRFIISILSASLLTLTFCSCTSTSVQPSDPFSVPLATPNQKAVVKQNAYESIQQRESLEQKRNETALNNSTAPDSIPISTSQIEPKSDVLMYTPEYKPTYQPIQDPNSGGLVPKPNRVVQQPASTIEYGAVGEFGIIRPVVYLQENDPFADPAPAASTTKNEDQAEESDETKPKIVVVPKNEENAVAPQNVEPTAGNPLHQIAIDPSLNERGAAIVAAQQNGRECFAGPFRPNERAGFWPQDEYLADGGDANTKVYVKDDWSVHNLQLEDTVVHYDTICGRTEVTPSNRVHLYAPRFGSVRKIEGVLLNDQITAISGANAQLALNVDKGRQSLGYADQETSAGYARSRNNISAVDSKKKSTGASATRVPAGFEGIDAVMYYTNWLTQSSVGSAELVYLAEGSASARAWEGIQGVKIRVNALAAMSASSEEGAESFFQIKLPDCDAKIRLIKVASKKSAQPGEIVEFTLRYDNLGTQPVGNVTLLDNLTTRLEFLPGTAKSSRAAGFIAEPNDGGSFTLRWEITDPLEPMEFGVVQFQCRVR